MNTKKPANTWTLAEAAKELGIGHRKMINKLRDDRILTVERTPYVQWMREGFFKIQETSFTLPNSQIQKCSARTLVTLSGLILIRSAMDDQPLGQEPANNETK